MCILFYQQWFWVAGVVWGNSMDPYKTAEECCGKALDKTENPAPGSIPAALRMVSLSQQHCLVMVCKFTSSCKALSKNGPENVESTVAVMMHNFM